MNSASARITSGFRANGDHSVTGQVIAGISGSVLSLKSVIISNGATAQTYTIELATSGTDLIVVNMGVNQIVQLHFAYGQLRGASGGAINGLASGVASISCYAEAWVEPASI